MECAWSITGTNLEEREHLALFFPVQQTMVVLHGDKLGEVVRYRIACRKWSIAGSYSIARDSLCIA